MGQKIEYRHIQEIEQLRRRVEVLENRCGELYEEHRLMYNILKSKHSFLDFSFLKEEYEEEYDLEEEEEIELDPVNWEDEFSELFDEGALDDIIDRGI